MAKYSTKVVLARLAFNLISFNSLCPNRQIDYVTYGSKVEGTKLP
jgi:hypothetical protein